MDAANLIDKFKCRGLKLVLAEGKVRVFPRKLLTDDDRVQIKKFKDDLLYLLSRRQAVEPPVTTPVITSTTLRAPAAEAGLELPAPAEGSFIPSTGASTGRQWECVHRYCLHQVRWWMSKYGVVQCGKLQAARFSRSGCRRGRRRECSGRRARLLPASGRPLSHEPRHRGSTQRRQGAIGV